MNSNLAHTSTEPEFTEVIQTKQNIWMYEIKIPENLIYFQGHFNNYPVTPGIIQLKWVIELIEKKIQHPLQVKKIQAMKFNNLLRPNDCCTIEIGWQSDHFFYKLHQSNKKISSGKIIPSVKPILPSSLLNV